MANITIAHLLDPSNTVIAHSTGASVAATGLKRGVLYRVVADADSYINYGVAAAANTGIYLPAKTECWMVFGMADSQGTDLDVRVFSAGAYIFFTPAFAVPTF